LSFGVNRNLGREEELGWEGDDAVHQIVFDDLLTDLPFAASR
jgi:hypothetical protein